MKPLRYGLNPHQRDARYEAVDSGGLPFEVVSGELSYINLLDALNAWQLVHEAALVTGRITAASFKHVSPAGVAFDGDAPEFLMRTYNLTQDDLSPTAAAYLRARSSDARASYGDFIAVSHTVDLSAARLISRVTSDRIIAPKFDSVEAHRYGVETIAAPAGSIRDASIAQACRERGITLIHTPHRYFRH